MTLDEAMDATITRAQAQAEISRHGADWEAFLTDCGDREEYDGADVLMWLGY